MNEEKLSLRWAEFMHKFKEQTGEEIVDPACYEAFMSGYRTGHMDGIAESTTRTSHDETQDGPRG